MLKNIKEKLIKKHSYKYSVCSMCNTPIISRDATSKELKEYQSKFKDKGSVNKFLQTFRYIVIECKCGNPPETNLTIPTTIERIKELGLLRTYV